MLNKWAMMGNPDSYIMLKNGGSPVPLNMAGWELALPNGGLNGNSSMNRGCAIAVFDYQRVVK